MSDFVNYNKRSIKLPHGCKDLIDVLRPHGVRVEWLQQHLGIDLSRTVARGGMAKGTISDIEKHIQRAVDSAALTFTLGITPGNERLSFHVARVFQERFRASIEVETKTPEEASVRQFLSNHHLQAPDDSPTPGKFHPDVPVHLICRVHPLPPDAITLARLASGLFREVGEVKEELELFFHYHELVNAA